MVSLDTDFLIHLLRRKPEATATLRELVAQAERLTTTPVNAMELMKGAYGAKDPVKDSRSVQELLDRIEVLEYVPAVADTFGRLIVLLQRSGQAIGEFDAVVASYALAHGESVMTRNLREFKRVPGLMVRTW